MYYKHFKLTPSEEEKNLSYFLTCHGLILMEISSLERALQI